MPVQNASILFKLLHGNEILGARYMIEYFVEDSKSDENHSKILQNHIVSEVDDLPVRAFLEAMTLVVGAKRIYFFQSF